MVNILKLKHGKKLLVIGIIITLTLTPMQSYALEWFGEDNTVGAANFHWTYESDTGESNFFLTEYSSFYIAFAQYLNYKHDWTLSEGVGYAYFPTADFSTVPDAGGLCAGSLWGTNYLDPAHDYDDDNGDGCNEEVEVTHTDWEAWNHKVSTSKNYQFFNYYTKTQATGTFSGYLHFNHQVSAWLVEWQTAGWDLIDKDYYSFTNGGTPPPCSGGYCYESVPTSSVTTSSVSTSSVPISIDINPLDITQASVLTSKDIMNDNKLMKKIENKSKVSKIQIVDVFKETEDIESELDEAQKYSKKFAKKMKLDTAYSVITFDHPLSVDEVNDFVSQNDVLIHQYEGYGIDTAGENLFFGGMANTATHLSENEITIEGLEIEGIYAIWGNIPINNVNKIKNDANVLALDMRGFYNHILNWLNNGVSNILAVDYEINDLYWKYN